MLLFCNTRLIGTIRTFHPPCSALGHAPPQSAPLGSWVDRATMRPGSGDGPLAAREYEDSVFGAPTERTAFAPGGSLLPHTQQQQQHTHMLSPEMAIQEEEDDMSELLGNLGVERASPAYLLPYEILHAPCVCWGHLMAACIPPALAGDSGCWPVIACDLFNTAHPANIMSLHAQSRPHPPPPGAAPAPRAGTP